LVVKKIPPRNKKNPAVEQEKSRRATRRDFPPPEICGNSEELFVGSGAEM
jgi:hypothetical protein